MADLSQAGHPPTGVPDSSAVRTALTDRVRGADIRPQRPAHRRAVLNQAKGLVMAYLHVDAEAAFELLRAWAHVRSETVTVVAEDLVRAACVTNRSRSWDPEVFRMILTAMAHPDVDDAEHPIAVSVQFTERPPVVRVAGHLTTRTVPLVLDALEAAARRARPGENVMVDLSGLSHRRVRLDEPR